MPTASFDYDLQLVVLKESMHGHAAQLFQMDLKSPHDFTEVHRTWCGSFVPGMDQTWQRCWECLLCGATWDKKIHVRLSDTVELNTAGIGWYLDIHMYVCMRWGVGGLGVNRVNRWNTYNRRLRRESSFERAPTDLLSPCQTPHWTSELESRCWFLQNTESEDETQEHQRDTKQ